MIAVIGLHLMSYIELLEFIKDAYQAWRKTHNAPTAFGTWAPPGYPHFLYKHFYSSNPYSKRNT